MQYHWSKSCLNCISEHEGKCPNDHCAQLNYDPWGDPIPPLVYYPDGNCLEQYLANKAKQNEEETK